MLPCDKLGALFVSITRQHWPPCWSDLMPTLRRKRLLRPCCPGDRRRHGGKIGVHTNREYIMAGRRECFATSSTPICPVKGNTKWRCEVADDLGFFENFTRKLSCDGKIRRRIANPGLVTSAGDALFRNPMRQTTCVWRGAEGTRALEWSIPGRGGRLPSAGAQRECN